MPRTAQVNTYHFKCVYNTLDDINGLPLTRYFKTMDELSKFVGCCRSTLYNRIRKKDFKSMPLADATTKNGFLLKEIIKLDEPLPVYEKIMVHFE